METSSSHPVAEHGQAGRPLSSLPGPLGWPLVGNLLQFDLGEMHLQLEEWARTYGAAYRIRLGRREAMVISRADTITAVLRDRPGKWRRSSTMQAVLHEIGMPGVLTVEGDEWRRQRKLVMSAFDPGHLKRYFVSMVRVTERLKARLLQAARDEMSIDLQKLLMEYTVDVTAGLAFGIDMNTLENPGMGIQAHLEKLPPTLMKRVFALFPWWRYVRLPSDRAFDRHLETVHAAIRQLIHATRQRMAAEPDLNVHPRNLLEALVAARDDQGGLLSEIDLAGNVLTVLLGGEDTTANTMAWTLHFLHTHRDAWNELVASVDAALGDADVPRQFDVAHKLEVIEDDVNEALRLRPVAPGLLLENNEALVLDGISMPRDSLLICLMRPDAVNPLAADDASLFRPQRWRDARIATQATAADRSRDLVKSSMPFGAGPRMCPGRYLAMLEMKMVLSTIARNFELVEVGTDDGREPQERLAFSMYPVGLKLTVKPRRSVESNSTTPTSRHSSPAPAHPRSPCPDRSP
jgi:cytochrome P450